MDLLQQMLQAGQLSEFIGELVQIRNEELHEKAAWEFYLHKVFDKSFEEFMEANKPKEAEVFDDEYVETTKQKARDILKKFKLNK